MSARNLLLAICSAGIVQVLQGLCSAHGLAAPCCYLLLLACLEELPMVRDVHRQYGSLQVESVVDDYVCYAEPVAIGPQDVRSILVIYSAIRQPCSAEYAVGGLNVKANNRAYASDY